MKITEQIKTNVPSGGMGSLLKVLFFCLLFLYRPSVVYGQTNNANLSGLTASSMFLSPAFSSAVLQYTATVGSNLTSVSITPVLSDITASLTINGNAAASGTLSAPITLAAGSNTITIVVTAADRVTTKTYRIVITRSANEAINITSVNTLRQLDISSTNSIVVDPDVTVGYSSNINGFRVTISTGLQATDVLSYTGTLPSGITASAYDPATGVLAFSGTTSAANWQALLRTVKITIPSVPGDRSVVFSAGYLNAFNNGHFYEKISEPTGTDYSWTQSKNLAAAKTYLNYTGYLVTITSAEENAFIVQILDADAWIGATDLKDEINAAVGSTLYSIQGAAEGHWYWVTGPERGTNFWNGYRKPPSAVAGKPTGLPVGSLYNNWRTGYQPDNGIDVVTGWEHAGQIYETFGGSWNDLGDTAPWPKGYIVEYGGLPGDIQQRAANSITIRAVQNVAPTDIVLSNNTITEGNAVGDLIGNLSAVDANSAQLWETATFTLVAGIGSTDNSSFTISGNQLRAASVFNFATKNTYTIRVRVTDFYGSTFEKVFTILIRDTPVNLITSNTNNSFLICSPVTPVAVDPGINLNYNKTINGFKVIITDGLQAGDALTYSGTLPAGVSAVAFSSVTGILEFTGSASVADWQALLRTVQFKATAAGTGSRKITFAAGTLGAFTNAHYYELVSSATAIDWNSAKTQAAARTYLGYRGYLVTITSSAENNFLQQLLDADAWTGATDNFTEINTARNATTFATQALSEGRWYWVTGPEAGTNFSNGNNSPVQVTYMNWALYEPNNAASAEHYMHLYPYGTWNDFVVNDSRVKQYVVEYGGTPGDPLQTPVVSITMNVTANNAPTDITLSNNVSGENNLAGATIGDLFTTDADAGDVFAYSLVSGVGATDNASFSISGTQLKTNVVFNLATKSSYSIRVRSTDRCGQFFEKIFTIMVVAQETNCSDGIDNDGDGFVDCYDKSCVNSASCTGFFIGNDAQCTVTPSQTPVFSIAPKWASVNNSASNVTTPVIGDLDRDGTPEVVSANFYHSQLFLLNGQNGTIKSSLNLTFEPFSVAIGNVNNSSCGQIFVRGPKNGTNYVVYAYDCNLSSTPIWDTETLNQPFAPTLAADFTNAGGMLGLADFDGDGKTELYYRDEILDAATGIRLVKGNPNSLLAGMPIAADILGDSKLELIIGCRIYQVNFGARTKDAGSLTLLASLPDYYSRWAIISSTSVADYNQDGYLDVIASGSDGGANLNTTVFYWDVHNNTVKKFIERESTLYPNGVCAGAINEQSYLNGWKLGTGRVTIADIDGDGKMNAVYVSGRYLYALDENFNKKWRIVVNEYSGWTGCTLFDFNGDNAPEIVYRDELYLYIIKGTDGSIINQRKCLSTTLGEYPVVADVDGDGASDICVSCLTDDTKTQQDFNCGFVDNGSSQIRVYSSAGDPWLPSRRVWNQHGYFSVNINDDLTIPRQQQSNKTRFSSLPCAVGTGQPLNSFLTQTPFLNSDGCPQYIAPDLRIVASSLSYSAPVCPGTAYTASFTVTNGGEGTVQFDVPITFYKGDPSTAGAVRLATVTKNIYLSQGETQVLTGMNFSVSGSTAELYIVLNDPGTALPVTFPSTTLKECNYSNNTYHATIRPQLTAITAVKLSDNQQCPGAAASIPGNGSVKAYVNVAGTPNTTDYNFYWFNGDSTVIDNTPDFTGSTYTGLDEATYSVYGVHKLTGCQTKAGQVILPLFTPAPPSVTISELAANTSCAFPNGKLKAFVTPAPSAAGYTYAWYEGNNAYTSPKISVDSLASNLIGDQVYSVLVTDNRTGCENLQSRIVTNNTVIPVVTTTGSTLQCVLSVVGTVRALVNGSAAGHTFNWYTGNSVKPAADYSGSLVTNLGTGTYTVTAVNSAGCISAPQQAVVTASIGFTVTPVVVSHLTSCATPNGALTANVGGVVSGYDFKWYNGQSTNPADLLSGPTNLPAGKYTVEASNPSTGCSAHSEIDVLDQRIYPVITNTVLRDNEICDPAAATGGAYNGRITTSVSYNGVNLSNYSGFEFKWYNGDSEVAGNINPTSTSRILDQLNGGRYSLRITHTSTQCSAPFNTVDLLNNTPPLNVLTDVYGSTSCDPALANGYIRFRSVNGDTALTTGYTYEWYPDTNTASPIPGANNRKLGNIQGGATSNYSGKITKNSTGCSYLLGETNVPDNREIITLNTSLTKPNTNCTGPVNGEAALISLNYKGLVDNLLTDYNINWVGAPAGQEHNAWITGLSAGNYDVTAVNKKDGCQYQTTLAVTDYLDAPVVQLTSTNVTVCTVQNGTVSAVVDYQNPFQGTKSYSGPYAYNLFLAKAAGNPLATDVISGALVTANAVTSKLFNNLSVGDYSIVAVNSSTGCISQPYLATVTDQTPAIALVAGTRVLPSDCDIAAGELIAGVDTKFLNGTVADPATDRILLGAIPGLPDGTPVTISADGALAFPLGASTALTYYLFNTGPSEIRLATDAAGLNTVDFTSAGNLILHNFSTGSYTFKWYSGIPVETNPGAGPINYLTNPPVFSGASVNSNVITNLITGTYTVEVTNPVNGCKKLLSHDLQYVNSHAVTVSQVNSTNCDVLTGNGSVTVQIIPPAGLPVAVDQTDFTIQVIKSGVTLVSYIPAGPVAPEVVTNTLAPGLYELKVSGNYTGKTCTVTNSFQIDAPKPPLLLIDNLISNKSCNLVTADGSFRATVSKDLTDVIPVTGFELNINPDPQAVSPVINVASNASVTFSGLTGQTYTITATSSAGCITTKTVNIVDQPVHPVVTSSVVGNSSCDINYDGQITITASTPSGPGVAANYDLTWSSDPDGLAASYRAANAANWGGSYSTLNTDRIGAGLYGYRVLNRITGCFTDGSVQVGQIVSTSRINAVAISGSILCAPLQGNGSATISGVSLGLVSDYTYSFGSLPNQLNTTVATPLLSSSLNPGNYFVRGLKNTVLDPVVPGVSNSGCYTETLVFNISDVHVNPTIAAAVTDANKYCIAGNGRIFVPQATPANYLFSWYIGNGTGGASIVPVLNGTTIENLTAGNYTLVLTDLNTQCKSNASYVVTDQPTQVSITPADIQTFPITGCDPVTGNRLSGAARINGLQEDGVAVGTGNYNFDWFEVAGNIQAASPLIDFNLANAGRVITEGTYFIHAQSTITGCAVTTQFSIEDQTKGSVSIGVDTFNNPEICINAADGSITVFGTGTGAAYIYEWYDGNQLPLPAGPVINATNTLSIPWSNYGAGQDSLTYTVRARNISDNCFAVEAFDIPLIKNPVIVSATSSPVTFCADPNGTLSATVIGDTKFDYDFTWTYIPDPQVGLVAGDTVIQQVGSDLLQQAAGDYSVVAIDKTDARCVSSPILISIQSRLEYPMPLAVMVAPQSFCDPENPNGAGMVSVDGNTIDYIFEWHYGPLSDLVHVGPDFSSAVGGVYSITATNRSTGCDGFTSLTIEDHPDIPADPIVSVDSQLTSCVENNGALSVSVSGLSSDYLLQWYNSGAAVGSADATGEFYSNLDSGVYTLTATGRVTKCRSNPVSVRIESRQIYPMFELLMQEANCKLNDGYLTLALKNDAQLDEVLWYKDGSMVRTGPNLDQAAAGNYQVTIKTAFGCEAESASKIISKLNLFNGISKSTDGLNNMFYIDCIEEYPNNQVQIFNRWGTKIYEGTGYDNATVYFDGKSNAGITLLPDNAPSGTYYYIINKGDGSEKLVGYLELVD